MDEKLKYKIRRLVDEWESNPDPTFEEFMTWNKDAFGVLKFLDKVAVLINVLPKH